jgi:PTH1 family peptidyl-tRNA hydrolase
VKLIVGLGNPGLEYERTRHNAGFLAVDRLAERHARGTVPRGRFSAITLEAAIGGEKCLLMKPTTYMNRSGAAVAEAARFFKLAPEADVLVIADDTALPAGTIRVRASGSDGGHNGLADVARLLGTEQYARCRVGVDGPGVVRLHDYVVGRFGPEQWEKVSPALDAAADAAEVWVEKGVTAAMNRFNVRPAGAGGAGGAGGEKDTN